MLIQNLAILDHHPTFALPISASLHVDSQLPSTGDSGSLVRLRRLSRIGNSPTEWGYSACTGANQAEDDSCLRGIIPPSHKSLIGATSSRKQPTRLIQGHIICFSYKRHLLPQRLPESSTDSRLQYNQEK
jgi:hypothetical protein